MGKTKKKQEEPVVENTDSVLESVEPAVETIESVAKTEEPKVTPKKKSVKETKSEDKVVEKELTGTWKQVTNPITFAVKYRCSNCGKYIIPNGKPISKINECIFCGSKNSSK